MNNLCQLTRVLYEAGYPSEEILESAEAFTAAFYRAVGNTEGEWTNMCGKIKTILYSKTIISSEIYSSKAKMIMKTLNSIERIKKGNITNENKK